jgi:integrase
VGLLVGFMTKQKRPFTAKHVENLKALGSHVDPGCEGLYLQITQGSHGINKSWIFRYTSPAVTQTKNPGRPARRELGLGSTRDRSLSEARIKVGNLRKLILEGVDPKDAKDNAKKDRFLAASKQITFSDAAQKCIDAKKTEWKNQKHKTQWVNTINTFVNPIIGNLPINSITTNLVIKVFEQPIKDKNNKTLGTFWNVRTETATRTRQRIESIIDWAKAREYFTGENPARYEGHLSSLLPNPSKIAKVKHHPALPYKNISTFMTELRSKKTVAALALEFLILTATRTSEVINATWLEFDLKEKIWTIPSERMKAGKEHRVPLCKRASEILKSLKQLNTPMNQHVFLSRVTKKGPAPMSNMALLTLMKKMPKYSSFVPHGFRSTFRDWAAETTNYQNETVELALAHTIQNKTEASYRREDQLEKRRLLMNDWGQYLG